MASLTDDSGETDQLLQRAAQGDQQGWGVLLKRHRVRLRRMVALRLDRRLQGRIDASDIIQDAYQEAWSRLPEYLRQRPAPFFMWLRYLTGQKLLELHRHHLGTQMRDAGREVSLYRGSLPETSSAALADQLLGRDPRPSEAAVRAEMKIRLQEALNTLEPLDREVLALRHFEHLSNAETAQLLEIEQSAASKRYLRALKRLKEILQNMPGGLGELRP
jgi:RNA polymerase sigma-70 factor (ECF subfamily)